MVLFLLFKIYFKNKTNKRLNQIALDKLKEADSWYYKYQKALQIIKKNEQDKEKAIQRSKERKEQEELKLLKYLKDLESKKSLEHRLNLIEKCDIKAKINLLGIHEFIIYKELIFCEKIKKNFIVYPQVSLAAFIKDDTKYSGEVTIKDQAWATYSSLRADFLFVLKDFKTYTTKPFAILEFNGSGHYGIDDSSEEEIENVKNRDEIKKETIRKAGLKIYTLWGEEIYRKDNPHYIDEKALKTAVDKIATTFEEWLKKR